jgi:hypothetical protein
VPPFSFLTNHGQALLCIAADPRMRIRDLIDAEYIGRTREGRRNVYSIRTDLAVRLPAQRDVEFGSLLGVLLPKASSGKRRKRITGSRDGLPVGG